MNKRIQILPSSTGTALTGWMVQSDFDGTISLLDVTDTLLNRFGKRGWQELEDAWERGDIGSRECMKGQVALLDMSEIELQTHLDTIEIDGYFVRFVQEAKALGIKVQVVSDGIDYAIRHVLERNGLADLEVIANHLVQTGERSWRLDSPWASNHCARASGNCKCERLAEQQAVHGRVLYIGDSTSDFCVSGKADFVLAKYKLIAYCESKGIAHARFEHFGQATQLLEQVVLGMEQVA